MNIYFLHKSWDSSILQKNPSLVLLTTFQVFYTLIHLVYEVNREIIYKCQMETCFGHAFFLKLASVWFNDTSNPPMVGSLFIKVDVPWI